MRIILAAVAAFFASTAAIAVDSLAWVPKAGEYDNVPVLAEWADATGVVQVRFGNRDFDAWKFATMKPGQRLDCRKPTFGGSPVPAGVPLGCEVLVMASSPDAVPSQSPNAPPEPVPMRGPLIDVGQWWQGFAGKDYPDVYDTTEQPASSTTGAFRVVCDPSHMAFDDPLVYPGQPGKSHLHVFFGNTTTNAYTTDATLLKGGSTCRGGTIDQAAYWVPAMIDTSKGGAPKRPVTSIFYYKNGYFCKKADLKTTTDCSPFINAIPDGLHMISGAAMSSAPQDMITYYCVGAPYTGKSAKTWTELACVKEKGAQAAGGTYQIQIGVKFPECWDGKNLTAPDNKSHMVFASASYKTQNACPATHPVRLQSLSEEIRYQVAPGEDPTKWRLASDMYSTDIAPGYSMHADYMAMWKETVNDPETGKQIRALEAVAKYCNRAQKDCHAHLLGNGQAIR